MHNGEVSGTTPRVHEFFMCCVLHCLKQNDAGSCDLHARTQMCHAAGKGEQACMAALLDFLGMVPELRQAVEEDAPGSALTGCERDCKHLAFKALTLFQQVTC